MDAGKLDENVLLAEEHISLEDHLKHSEITRLIASPVEVIAFCEEEGVRSPPLSLPLLPQPQTL